MILKRREGQRLFPAIFLRRCAHGGFAWAVGLGGFVFAEPTFAQTCVARATAASRSCQEARGNADSGCNGDSGSLGEVEQQGESTADNLSVQTNFQRTSGQTAEFQGTYKRSLQEFISRCSSAIETCASRCNPAPYSSCGGASGAVRSMTQARAACNDLKARVEQAQQEKQQAGQVQSEANQTQSITGSSQTRSGDGPLAQSDSSTPPPSGGLAIANTPGHYGSAKGHASGEGGDALYDVSGGLNDGASSAERDLTGLEESGGSETGRGGGGGRAGGSAEMVASGGSSGREGGLANAASGSESNADPSSKNSNLAMATVAKTNGDAARTNLLGRNGGNRDARSAEIARDEGGPSGFGTGDRRPAEAKDAAGAEAAKAQRRVDLGLHPPGTDFFESVHRCYRQTFSEEF